MATMEPMSSGVMTRSRRCVLMMAGFSSTPASFLAFFSFFTRALCLRLSGRESRRRTRDVNCGWGVVWVV